MITLYGFGPAFRLIDPSPFVVKVHFLLQLSGLPYKVKNGVDGLRKAPKGKLPYIEDKEIQIADSHFVQKYLEDEYTFDVDKHLTPEQKAISVLACSAIEEQLYWYVVYFRWADDKNWSVLKEAFFGEMPFPLNKIVPKVARKDVLSTLKGQGTSRHSDDEIVALAKIQFEALSHLLGDKEYFFNNEVSMLDVVTYSLLVQILMVPLSSPLKGMAEKHSNLVRFCQNIHQQYFSEKA
ncbi:glutathione S-transferase family protein [Agaribacter marinus]|uniref:Glutathione S-transferase n=1 Tax=Agaribacter marinus TaxID=1431249 RepID=A0AA37T213_9ALTE|nr:glutathione S-transferase family protein [Agaribacter marinus]GLR72116.1 hypothetical protein GCM10007852_30240 [Agaribacter marinus]